MTYVRQATTADVLVTGMFVDEDARGRPNRRTMLSKFYVNSAHSHEKCGRLPPLLPKTGDFLYCWEDNFVGTSRMVGVQYLQYWRVSRFTSREPENPKITGTTRTSTSTGKIVDRRRGKTVPPF